MEDQVVDYTKFRGWQEDLVLVEEPCVCPADDIHKEFFCRSKVFIRWPMHWFDIYQNVLFIVFQKACHFEFTWDSYFIA